MEQAFVDNVLPKLGLDHIIVMPRPPKWLSYDREGDTLHVVFEEAKKSDKSTLDKNDVVVTKRGKNVVNMTILHASRFIH